MIASFPATGLLGAALWQKACRAANVILHIGAHRGPAASFQTYMQANAVPLAATGIGFWGRLRTRSGCLCGVQTGPGIAPGCDIKAWALGRVPLRCGQRGRDAVERLIVSDQNMLVGMRANLRLADLYHSTPPSGLVLRLARRLRGWGDVISDIACAGPDAEIRVIPFETFAGHPDARLHGITDPPVPRTASREWHNTAPDLAASRVMMDPAEGKLPEGEGRWMPFSQSQCAMRRERYADDLMWLAAGPDGLARLVADPAPEKAGPNLPIPDMTRGRDDERRHITVARAGREGTARQAD